MHTERLTAAILDMWYGTREAWRDESLPLAMDIGLADPAFIDHQERDWINRPIEWAADPGADPLGDWHGRNR